MTRLWIVLLCFVSLAISTASKPKQLKWIKKNYTERETYVYLEGNWTADCRLNDPNVTVELKEKYDQVDLSHPKMKKHVRQEGQNFTLYNMQPRLSGVYCCHAAGEVNIKDKCLRKVKVQPFKENYEIEVNAYPNGMIVLDYYDDLTVKCESIHDGTLQWFYSTFRSKVNYYNTGKNQQVSQKPYQDRYHPRGYIELADLKITNTTNDVAGKYLCEKTDNFNNKKAIEIEIKVNAPKPPSIIWATRKTNVTTGREATLHCRTQGSPKPKVTWYNKENKTLAWCTGGQRDRCNVEKNLESRYIINNTRLVIKNVTYTNDFGLYYCVAENVFGLRSRTLFLAVLVKPKIKQRQDSQFCNEKPDGTCELVCEVQPSVPQPNITWFYQSGQCTNATCKTTVNSWESVPSGVAEFNVTPVHLEKDGYRSILTVASLTRSGFFQCKAMNMLGADTSVYRVNRGGNIFDLTNPSTRQWQWYIFAGISSFLIAIFLIALTKLYKNKRRYGQFYIIDDPIAKLDPKKPLIEQSQKLHYDYQWEFPAKGIHLEYVLGSGHYGEVYLAEASGVIVPDSKGRMRLKYISNSAAFNRNDQRKFTSKVAVKKLKHDATQLEYRELISELKIFIHIGWHENVVNLLGACTKVSKQRGIDVMIITEYCPYGNVLDFLRTRRETFRLLQTEQVVHTEDELTLVNLVKWAHQVAKGMEFLASRTCIHRDLAARNVLIGNQFTAKIADFGLARDIYKTMHYTVTTSMVPLKWTAIEALQDGISNFKSDVWSFGVFLWELFTLGGEPYPTLTTAHEVMDYLLRGERMAKPSYCPFEIYTIMMDCWQHDPKTRPNFTELVKTVGDFQDNLKADENHQELESEANLLLG